MGKVLIPVIATVIVCLAMAYQARTVEEPVLCEVPRSHLTEIAGFDSQSIDPSEAEKTTLPADTQFDKRQYADAEGHGFWVSLVIGGRSKSSIHRPELCLPTQGFQMSNPHRETVEGIDWHFLTIRQKSASPMCFCYTFFNQKGFRTSSHTRRIIQDVWDRSIHGRIDRWAMLTVNAFDDDEKRLKEFLPKLKGVIDRE